LFGASYTESGPLNLRLELTPSCESFRPSYPVFTVLKECLKIRRAINFFERNVAMGNIYGLEEQRERFFRIVEKMRADAISKGLDDVWDDTYQDRWLAKNNEKSWVSASAMSIHKITEELQKLASTFKCDLGDDGLSDEDRDIRDVYEGEGPDCT